ncbi:MAG TPA: toxic anion resistance protein [Jatrophihabitantaceae bacterium]|nr:toxic anion resistance protein [Jatrophihabitantaceae bacterium]
MSDSAAAALTPPSELTLQAPEPVKSVEPAKAGGMVPIPAAALPALDQKVAAYVDSIVTLDVHSPAFTAKADDVRTMGNDEIRASAETSNTLLASPVRAMQKSGDTGKVATTLLDLRRTVEDLDPKQATGAKKLLGMIPFGDRLRDYFHKYESAQSHIDAILKALLDGQDELRKDNAALDQEKVHLWETMQRLAQYAYVAEHLDKALEAKIAQLSDAEKAKVLRDDVLYAVRQKHQDLLTQLAVAIQGYLAIDLVRKNNLELIKGVDRATTTTVSALRTAVIVAQALANQKLVLDQITALNTTTANLIESTSQLLATQGVAIQKQSAESTIGIQSLQRSFDNVYQAMDSIDTFKVAALDSMKQTIGTLQGEIDKAQSYVARVRVSDGNQAGSNDLNLSL